MEEKNLNNLIEIVKKITLPCFVLLALIFTLYSVYVKYWYPYREIVLTKALNEESIKNLNLLRDTLEKSYSDISSTTLQANTREVYVLGNSNTESCEINTLPSLNVEWGYKCKKDFEKKVDKSIFAKNTFLMIASDKNFCIAVNTPGLDAPNNKIIPNYYTYCSDQNLFNDAYGIILNLKMKESDGLNILDMSRSRTKASLTATSSMSNESINFNGENFLTIIDNDIMQKIGKPNFDYSIILSFKTNQALDQSLTEKWTDGKYPFSLRGPYPGIQFALYDGKSNPAIASNKNYADDKWHQIIAVRNTKDKTMTLYMDGARISTIPDTTSDDISNIGNFTVGSRNPEGDKKFKGEISEFIIINRIISESEMSYRFKSK
jgi:Concanavalin A-like lectin/glucanases superfamily